MRLPDIRHSDLLKIRAFHSDLSTIDTKDELIERALRHFAKIVPADFLCWNEFDPVSFAPKYFQTSDDYADIIKITVPRLSHTIDFHPVISRLGWESMDNKLFPYRLSDFETLAKFRHNPIFREVYRHLDSNYQLAYGCGTTSYSIAAFATSRTKTCNS